MIEAFLRFEPTSAYVCAAVGALLYSVLALPRVYRGMVGPNGAKSRTSRTWYGVLVLSAVAVAATCAFGAAIGATLSPAAALAAAWASWSF